MRNLQTRASAAQCQRRNGPALASCSPIAAKATRSTSTRWIDWAVEVHGLGRIARGVGELILAVLAQVADMERHRIRERTEAGRDKARASLAATGRTHKGKASLGRPKMHDPRAVAQWRQDQGASIAATALHFACSPASVKRYCAEA